MHAWPIMLFYHDPRTLLSDMGDVRNVNVHNQLVSGELPTQSLVRMSGPDMANPQLVRQRKKWIKKRTHEVMRAGREVEDLNLTNRVPQLR